MQYFERLFKFALKPWVMFIFIVLMVLSFYFVDKPVAYYFYALQIADKFPLFYWITELGRTELFVFGSFAVAIFYRYILHNKAMENKCWFLFFCILIPAAICLLLKVFLGRARPELLFSEHLYGFYGFETPMKLCSFPSGHTSAICGLAIGLLVLLPRYRYLWLIVAIMLVSLRVILLHHYLSDVLSSFYLVVLELGLYFYYLQRKPSCFKSMVSA